METMKHLTYTQQLILETIADNHGQVLSYQVMADMVLRRRRATINACNRLRREGLIKQSEIVPGFACRWYLTDDGRRVLDE